MSQKKRRAFPNPARSFHQANLNGSSRGVLPVIWAMALANAGASGGSPGSPMPLGGSALGTMCTATWGHVGDAWHGKVAKVALLHHAVLERDGGARQAHRQAHQCRALHLGLHAFRVDGQVAVHARRHAVQLGRAVFTDASTT